MGSYGKMFVTQRALIPTRAPVLGFSQDRPVPRGNFDHKTAGGSESGSQSIGERRDHMTPGDPEGNESRDLGDGRCGTF